MSRSDELSAWLEGVARRLEALAEWEQRAIQFAQRIQQLPLEQASTAFDHLLASAFAIRSPRSIVGAESALLAALKGHWPGEHRARVREEAAAADDRLTLRFLLSGELALPLDDDEDEQAVPDYGGERPLTLGERKTLATKPTRRIIERALLDPHPMVARKLLANPKLTEGEVLRIAARRPGPPGVLAEIALHPRWRRRRRIALALVYNHYLPTSFGLSLLPWLDSRAAAEVAADARLHDDIRGGARDLLRAAAKKTQHS